MKIIRRSGRAFVVPAAATANRTRTTKALATIGIALVLVTSVPSGANANDDNPVVEVLESAEIAALGAATPTDTSPPMIRADGGGAVVDMSDADLSVTLGASSNPPIAEYGPYATVLDASITYAVSYPTDRATRFSAILATSADEKPRWTFESGTELLLLSDGSVSVAAGGRFIGGIDRPWAVDAEGRSLPTNYEVSGSTLTQVVDTTAATFPVVVDPTVQFFGPYIQVHLNRYESITAISGFGACAAILGKSKVPIAKLLQVACGAVVAIGSAQLVAGKCISLHFVVGLGGPIGAWWPWIRDC